MPAWCFITACGRLETPAFNFIWLPSDAARSLDIFWDGLWCRADYFTWYYGEVYRYEGWGLPRGEQWQKRRYLPSLELEIQVVNLAARNIEFDELLRRVKRPKMEIAAILDEHGYNGRACTIHYGLKTRLLSSWEP